MGKYVDRILDEVYYNFERHFIDPEEQIEFLEELIEDVDDVLKNLIDKLSDAKENENNEDKD